MATLARQRVDLCVRNPIWFVARAAGLGRPVADRRNAIDMIEEPLVRSNHLIGDEDRCAFLGQMRRFADKMAGA